MGAVLSLLVFLTSLTACPSPKPDNPPPPETPSLADESPIRFTDTTAAAGITFVHTNGATERRYLPETMGSGAAFFDYDGDDRPDLYLVNGAPVAPEASSTAAPPGVLYRNLGEGRFEDVTRRAGLGEGGFPGMGAAVGDVDGDGHLDLLVTGVGEDRLWRNRGDGTFEDITARSGLGRSSTAVVGFSSGAAFLDFDLDGRLDLFLCRYVRWSVDSDVRCTPDGEHPSYCTPEVYPGVSNRLYRGLGNGRFEDVTRRAGVQRADGKALGVVVFDADRDGWPDLAVANDTARNFLFRNQGDGTFVETAVEDGLAFSVSGATRGAMGIDAGDLDGDGFTDVVIGNFSQEMSALYRGSEAGLFRDEAAQAGVGLPSLMTLAFGTLVVDLDLDGWQDLVFANGHIEPEIARFQSLQSYAQPLMVFRNRGEGKGFERVESTAKSGESGIERDPLAQLWVGRGLAAADIDGDGDLDLVLTQNGGPARLLRNDAPPRSWLRIRLRGRASNPDGYGAVVTVFAGGRRLERTLTTGRSYLSASEPVLTFGLGEIRTVDRLEVRWPSGQVQNVLSPPVQALLTLEEPPAASGS